MRELKLFMFLVIGIFTYIGCSDQAFEIEESSNSQSTNEIHLRSSNSSSCGFIDALCNPCDNRAYAVHEVFTICCDSLVSGGNETSSLRVIPIDGLSGSMEFLVKTESGDFILSNTTNSYVKNKLQDLPYPKYLNNLFYLDPIKIRSNDYSDSELQSDLKALISRDENNNIVIDPSTFTIIDDDIQARAADPCKFQRMEVMEDYYTELNQPLEVYSEVLLEIWMNKVDPLFEECSQGINLDRDCIDSRCIVDGIVNDLSIAPNRKRNLKINYLALLLDLDQIEIDALDNASNEMLDELYAITECGTLTFCPTQNDQNEIIEGIIKSLIISNGSISLEEFREELEKEDWILLDNSFSSNSIINCVWQKIIESDNELMCSTINNFYGPTKFNINLYVQDLNGQNGVTNILPSGNFSISIDIDFINEACTIEMLETILHEAIHAEILRRQNTYTIAELEQMYPEMMIYFNDPNISDFQHEYMANEWFDTLLNAVKEFYPNGYTEEQYQAIAWSGLHNTDAFDEGSGMTASQLTSILDDLREDCKPCE